MSELSAANEGIGYLLVSAGSAMKMPLAFAGLEVIAVMAMAMCEPFAVVERRMTGLAHCGRAGWRWAGDGPPARVDNPRHGNQMA